MRKDISALVGLGNFGKNILRTLKEINWSPVIVCDTDPKKLEGLTETRLSNNLNDIINSGADVVFVATPAKSHYQICETLLNAGKHVFVEKPITLSLRETNNLITIAKNNNCILSADYTFCWDVSTDWLKEQDFGDITSVSSIRTNWGSFETDVGVIYDLAVHCISLAYSLFGLPISVQTFGSIDSQTNQNEEALVILKYKSFDFKSIVSRKSIHKTRLFEIHSSTGSYCVDYQNNKIFTSNTKLLYEVILERQPPLKKELLYFRDVINGKKEQTNLSFHSNISAMVDAAEESLERFGKEVVL